MNVSEETGFETETEREVEQHTEYEYKVVEHDGEPPLEELLNEYGSGGWRFVELVQYDNVEFAVFERVESGGVVSITSAERDGDGPSGLLGIFR